jgi:hypothetical protein
MKLNPDTKYEVSIAKTTIPKGLTFIDLTIGKWYPIYHIDNIGPTTFSFKNDVGMELYSLHMNSSHLAGGNWKVRKVKDKKCSK